MARIHAAKRRSEHSVDKYESGRMLRPLKWLCCSRLNEATSGGTKHLENDVASHISFSSDWSWQCGSTEVSVGDDVHLDQTSLA